MQSVRAPLTRALGRTSRGFYFLGSSQLPFTGEWGRWGSFLPSPPAVRRVGRGGDQNPLSIPRVGGRASPDLVVGGGGHNILDVDAPLISLSFVSSTLSVCIFYRSRISLYGSLTCILHFFTSIIIYLSLTHFCSSRLIANLWFRYLLMPPFSLPPSYLLPTTHPLSTSPITLHFYYS